MLQGQNKRELVTGRAVARVFAPSSRYLRPSSCSWHAPPVELSREGGQLFDHVRARGGSGPRPFPKGLLRTPTRPRRNLCLFPRKQ